jgi:hypothetical protein
MDVLRLKYAILTFRHIQTNAYSDMNDVLIIERAVQSHVAYPTDLHTLYPSCTRQLLDKSF